MSGPKKPLTWGDPPPQRVGGQHSELKHAHIIASLKERPGEWALVQTRAERSHLSLRASLNSPAYRRLADPYRIELTSRVLDDGRYGLWARVVKQGA